MITGIVAALPEEISTLTRQKIGRGCCTFIAPGIVLARSGAGPNNAKVAAERLVDRGAKRLISWGCAGALNETLKPGDLTLVATLVSGQMETIDIQSPWLSETRRILSGLKPHISGCLAESKTIVSLTEDKKKLRRQTQACVLDMESIAIAQIARQHNVPFLAIRAIADPVDMSLPQTVIQALNSEGDVVLSRLLSYLARHPSELTRLVKLGRHFNAAQKTLKLAARYLDAFTR
ncbi:MAG: phosphorylase [Gammaproteobacteria bacterium HGW-Gammaproteobacteria-3]|nr:MAG: phosphorylase [Gammaproteobacteria bacterium HGW-Gammaproteobacteria-3]